LQERDKGRERDRGIEKEAEIDFEPEREGEGVIEEDRDFLYMYIYKNLID